MRSPRWNTAVRRIAPVAILAGVTLAVAACGSNSTVSGSDGKKPIKIAFFGAKGNTYDQAAVAAGEKVVKEAGGTSQFFDVGFDPTKEFNALQDAITSGKFSGFVLDPVDPASIAPGIRQAIKAGIAVGTFDQPSGPDPTTADVQVEGIAGALTKPMTTDGQDLGDAIIAACKGVTPPCEVGYILGLNSLQPEQKRFAALKDQLKQAGGINIVAKGEGQFLADPSIKVAQDMLTAHPGLDVIATGGDQMTAGAEKAVNDANRTGKVKLIGAGASKVGVDAVRAGRWYATTLFLPEDEGRVATELAIKKIQGKDVSQGLDSTSAQFRGGTPRILTADNKADWANFKAQWAG